MKAFNYNINFVSEPSLNDGKSDPSLDTIRIIEAEESFDCGMLKYHSEYEEIVDSRKLRYCAEREFSQCLNQGCTWALEIQNIVTFVWQIGSQTITYVPHSQFTLKRLHFWLLYRLLALKFMFEYQYNIFHVGAVSIGGECVAFAANCYGGKSTLTDFFVRQGYTMFSDDVLGIYQKGERYFAVPSFPYVLLRNKSEDMGYPINNVAGTPKPLKAIYVLEKSQPDASVLIEKVTGVEKFKVFPGRSLLDLDFLDQSRFKKHCSMAINIPIYRITVPRDKKRLEEVKCAIVAHSSDV